LKKEKELNELKTKFLSLVSHEFKTPLSGILTSAVLLGKYKLSEQQDRRDKHIKTISEKVHYLNNILNDFLSIEKLETGKITYNFSTFKISKVVNEVVYNANMLLKEGQTINYPENIDDYALFQDEKIVELALSNLVHNAIKYSSENTLVDIQITQDETYSTFIIKDNGIGIPENDQKSIFNRYFRAENALLTQGTGIGLNIVKSHLENLGGSIRFISEEHVGSEFTFILPNKAKQ
ncbi:MAG TPA: HAMP domain-containing sensor histidine kinase, partial [Mariniflexile sp.]|nr:HAMP domain-containing sensor histidine kinase [Mariniflexile sp.]